jgi:6,7-dimethyl-8-ribityllumazine synthase
MFSKGLDWGDGALQSTRGAHLRVAIVSARWNKSVVEALVSGAERALRGLGVHEISRYEVPGSFELAGLAARLQARSDVDAVICVGVLVKGESMHFEYISSATSHAIAELNTRVGKAPVVFGVLTCLSDEQAMSRSGLDGKGHNHGEDWGIAAVEMALLFKQVAPQ